jgi:hypothetical protein
MVVNLIGAYPSYVFVNVFLLNSQRENLLFFIISSVKSQEYLLCYLTFNW